MVPTPDARLKIQNSHPNERFSSRPRGSGRAWRGRRKIAAIAGLNVSELMVEMIVETAMVTANWRKNWPVIPRMNAQGTNTAHSTRATATMGPVTSSIAL